MRLVGLKQREHSSVPRPAGPSQFVVNTLDVFLEVIEEIIKTTSRMGEPGGSGGSGVPSRAGKSERA